MESQKHEYTIITYTENCLGSINRISAIFSSRKINIENINIVPSEVWDIKKFIIVVKETDEVVEKLSCQIEKQVDVLGVYYYKKPSKEY